MEINTTLYEFSDLCESISVARLMSFVDEFHLILDELEILLHGKIKTYSITNDISDKYEISDVETQIEFVIKNLKTFTDVMLYHEAKVLIKPVSSLYNGTIYLN